MIYVILFILLVVFAFYAFKLSKKRPVQSFPESWEKLLTEHVHFYRDMPKKKKKDSVSE